MAVFIEANYSKKLGLPQYSSHQYSVTIRTELSDVSQLAQASTDLYAKLQQAVDSQIVNPGLVPGSTAESTPSQEKPRPQDDCWKCSDKQRELILKIVDQHHLDKAEVDALAQERFGAGVRQLNKIQASALIDELLETYGDRGNQRRTHGRTYPTFAGRSR